MQRKQTPNMTLLPSYSTIMFEYMSEALVSLWCQRWFHNYGKSCKEFAHEILIQKKTLRLVQPRELNNYWDMSFKSVVAPDSKAFATLIDSSNTYHYKNHEIPAMYLWPCSSVYSRDRNSIQPGLPCTLANEPASNPGKSTIMKVDNRSNSRNWATIPLGTFFELQLAWIAIAHRVNLSTLSSNALDLPLASY